MTPRNTITPTTLKNSFLTSYLLADVLFSGYCQPEEMRAIYAKYAEVFCIRDNHWLEQTWNIVSLDLFRSADNVCDFNRLARLAQQYPEQLSPAEINVLTHKTKAIQIKSEILNHDDDASFDSIISTLERRANGTDVDCMALFGFLEYHGFLVEQNPVSAQSKLETAASWNNFPAILMGCHYLLPTALYHNKLCALLGTACNQDMRSYLLQVLQIPSDAVPDKIALAIEYAFCHGTFHSITVSPGIMKLIRSPMLSENDKCRLIRTTGNQDNIISQIPLEVCRSTEIIPNLVVLSAAMAKRRAEAEQILENLSMLDLRDTSAYKPLLIVCEDEMVLEFYREAICRCFSEYPIAQVDMRDKDARALTYGKSNVIISAMEKSGEKNMVMMFLCCDALEEEQSEQFARLMKAHNRKHFKASETASVEVDLSGIVPILFSSRVPAQSIADCCDIVFGQELSKEEFCQALEGSLERKRTQFKLNSLSIEPQAADFLFKYSSATIANLLNKAIGQLRCSTKEVNVTVKSLQNVIDRYYTNKRKDGFWRNAT